jgi:hypothetical protein
LTQEERHLRDPQFVVTSFWSLLRTVERIGTAEAAATGLDGVSASGNGASSLNMRKLRRLIR